MSPKSSSVGRSALVSTATTPGIARAADVSMRTMRARACGLRTVAPWSIPSRARSLAYSNDPCVFGGASLRGACGCRRVLPQLAPPGQLEVGRLGAAPCGRTPLPLAVHASSRPGRKRSTSLPRGAMHRLEDLAVPRAAADVPRERLLYLGVA